MGASSSTIPDIKSTTTIPDVTISQGTASSFQQSSSMLFTGSNVIETSAEQKKYLEMAHTSILEIKNNVPAFLTSSLGENDLDIWDMEIMNVLKACIQDICKVPENKLVFAFTCIDNYKNIMNLFNKQEFSRYPDTLAFLHECMPPRSTTSVNKAV